MIVTTGSKKYSVNARHKDSRTANREALAAGAKCKGFCAEVGTMLRDRGRDVFCRGKQEPKKRKRGKRMICGYENGCMQEVERDCKRRCRGGLARCMNGLMILVGIIAGLVLAAAVVLLFINSLLVSVFPLVLAVLVTSLAVLLGTSAAALALPEDSAKKQCLRCHFGGLYFGIIGTVVASLLAIATDLAVGSVIAAVLLGLTAFFFAYLIVCLLFVTLCVTDS